MSKDQDPKVYQPLFLCGWCNLIHNGDCADDQEEN